METRRYILHRKVSMGTVNITIAFREQVEKAYAQLSEYYSQLQAAYNVIYAKMTELEKERTQNQQLQVDVLLFFKLLLSDYTGK